MARPRLTDEQRRLRGPVRADRAYPGSRAKLQPYWDPRKRDFDGLSPRSQAFIRRVIACQLARGLELTTKGGRLVKWTAHELDACDELRTDIEREGLQVPGSRGRLRTNPRVTDLRRRDRFIDTVCEHFRVDRPARFVTPEKVVQTEKSPCQTVSPEPSR